METVSLILINIFYFYLASSPNYTAIKLLYLYRIISSIQSLKRSSGDIVSRPSVTEDNQLRRSSPTEYHIVPGTPRRNVNIK